MRLQLALNVRDIDEAVAYYGKLFGTEPHKRRPGYANFAIAAPPLKLVLFENPNAAERLNHLGVEILEPGEVQAQSMRLGEAGILDEVERETLCCHSAQDKMSSHEPQGLKWEWYRITDDNPEEEPGQSAAACCAGGDSPEVANGAESDVCCA